VLRERRDGGARFPFVLDADAFAAARVTSRDADFFTEAGLSDHRPAATRWGRPEYVATEIHRETHRVGESALGAYVR